MSSTKLFDQSELIRLALIGLDAQIAQLQEKLTQLAALPNQQTASSTGNTAAPSQQKSRGMSDEAKAKISAAAKKRWARVKKAKAEAAKPAPTTKKAPAKKRPVKAR